MQGVDIEVLRTAMRWQRAGHRVVHGHGGAHLGFIAAAAGSLMVIREDGQVAGSVSGGCIEDDLVGRVLRGELAPERPQVVRYGQSADEAHRFGLPCGGTVEVVLEPLSDRSRWGEVISAIEGHQRVQRQLDLTSGAVSMSTVREDDRLRFDGHTLVTTHGPRHRLLIIGGGQLSRYLASMAVMLDYQVTVCEPRAEYHDGLETLDGVTLTTDMPDDRVLSMQLDERSAVVALTHDPKLDDLALMEALRTPAFYVGALGSRANNARRRERLLEFDVSPAQAARLRGPVGLRIGGRTPSEIALSILAEMTALRCGVALDRPLADWSSSTSSCQTAGAAQQGLNGTGQVESMASCVPAPEPSSVNCDRRRRVASGFVAAYWRHRARRHPCGLRTRHNAPTRRMTHHAEGDFRVPRTADRAVHRQLAAEEPARRARADRPDHDPRAERHRQRHCGGRQRRRRSRGGCAAAGRVSATAGAEVPTAQQQIQSVQKSVFAQQDEAMRKSVDRYKRAEP